MDAQELFEALTVTADKQLFCADVCTVGTCCPKCSLEVVDELLSMPDAVSGDEVDLLLDFRSLLRGRSDAEAALRLFCDLRRRLEQRHYLAFYRLRRWLENQIVALAFSTLSGQTVRVPLHLNFYCGEAIRRLCLCAALQLGAAGSTPRLTFSFIPLQPHLSGYVESLNLVQA